MKVYDFSPLFRNSVGFDRFADMAENAMGGEKETDAYPPYDIDAVGENAYRITVAVAGFGEDDLELSVKDQVLTVSGKRPPDKEKPVRCIVASRSATSSANFNWPTMCGSMARPSTRAC